MLFTSIVMQAFIRVMVVRQVDNLSLSSNQALLISYAVDLHPLSGVIQCDPAGLAGLGSHATCHGWFIVWGC